MFNLLYFGSRCAVARLVMQDASQRPQAAIQRFYSFVFVTAPDGRRLCFPFFPVGVFGRAYVISDADVARLRRLIATCSALCIGAGILIAELPPSIAGLVMLAVAVCYYGWMRYLFSGSQPRPARLTLRESMVAPACAHNPASLVVRMFLSLGFFVGGGVFIFDRTTWPIATAVIVFGCLCAASYATIFVVWCCLALSERLRRDAV